MTHRLARVLCSFGWHSFREVRSLPAATDILFCSRCRTHWGANHHVRVALPFDSEFVEMYHELYGLDLREYRTDKAPLTTPQKAYQRYTKRRAVSQ